MAWLRQLPEKLTEFIQLSCSRAEPARGLESDLSWITSGRLSMGRLLSDGETAVLTLIQQGYGPQNGIDKVFFTKVDQAVIFVKAADGSSPMMVNLSNLAAWRANGTISSDEELKTKWLRL